MRLLWGPAGPEREPVSTGEWVNLAGAIGRTAHLVPPDPLEQVVAELVRRFDPGGYQLQCPLSGCGWHLLVPRLELDPEPLSISPDGDQYVISVEGVPREDVELILRTHVDLHAVLTETDVRDAPVSRPPRWEQQEWCDGGATCEHPRCLDELARDWQEP